MLAFLFVLFLVFLVPLAIYCLVLALLNRRSQPVMVRGLWDCIGLLFASSGFLLVIGPVTLKMLYAKSVGDVPLDEQSYDQAVRSLIVQYWGITVVYFLFLVAGVGLLIWWRANKTIIYNVDSERLDLILQHTLTRLGFAVSRTGNQLIIGRAPAPSDEIVDLNAPADGTLLPHAPRPPRAAGEALVVVEPFAAMGNVTLHWFTEDANLRDEIENALRKNLSGARLYDNPAATWLLGIAGAIFSLIFIIALVIVLGVYFPPRVR